MAPSAVGPSISFLTDGVYMAKGRVAPIGAIVAALRPGDVLVVDDSHGLGVLGGRGRGSVEYAGVRDPRIVVTASLSKALGCSGGVIAGDASLVDDVRASDAWVGSTPIAPAIAVAARAALEILRTDSHRRARLGHNCRELTAIARRLGLREPELPLPVLAVPSGERDGALERAFADRGLFVPRISYPGVGTAFQVSLSSEHAPEHLARLEEALAEGLGLA